LFHFYLEFLGVNSNDYINILEMFRLKKVDQEGKYLKFWDVKVKRKAVWPLGEDYLCGKADYSRFDYCESKMIWNLYVRLSSKAGSYFLTAYLKLRAWEYYYQVLSLFFCKNFIFF
jgi:hypothetical protein